MLGMVGTGVTYIYLLSICYGFFLQLSLSCQTLGMVGAGGYNVTEIFDGRYVGMFKSSDNINITVNPSGVFFAKSVYLG